MMKRNRPAAPHALRLEAFEERLLLAAPVLIDSHTYAGGVTVSVYDTSPSDGISNPDIAWRASEYVAGVTDIYVNPNIETDQIIPSVSLFGDGSDTRDIGIAVEGHTILGLVQDTRTDGDPLTFFASTAPVNQIVLNRGTRGAELNGFTLAGGTVLPTDIDQDGDLADLQSLYVDGNATQVFSYRSLNGEAFLNGTTSGFETYGGLPGTVLITGDLGTGIVHGELTGALIVGLPGTNGSFANSIQAQNSSGIALSGLIDVNGSANAIYINGHNDGTINVTGNTTTATVYGETFGSLTFGEAGVSVSEVGTILLSEWYGTGLGGSLDIWGYANTVIVRGETSGTINVSEGIGALYTYGETSGGVTLGSPTTALRSPAYTVMGVCGAARSLSGSLDIYGDGSYVYFRGGVQGDVFVTGSVTTMRTNFGLTGSIDIGSGTADPNVVDVAFLKLMDGANSIGGPVTIHGNATTLEFVGRTTDNLTVEGNVNKMTLVGEGGPSTGNVNITGGLKYSISSGTLAGDWTVGGNITSLVHYGEVSGTFTLNGDTASRFLISNWGNVALSGALVAPNTDVTRLYLYGNLTGSFDIGSSYLALVAGGHVSNPGQTAMRIRGDATYLKVYDFIGPGANSIEGDVQVDGHLYMFYLTGGNFDGTLNLNSVDDVKYHCPAGLTGTMNVTGDLGRVVVSQAPISGTVNVGGLTTKVSAAHGITGTLNLHDVTDVTAVAAYTGAINVAGNAGNLSLGAVDDGTIDVTGDVARIGMYGARNATINVGGHTTKIMDMGDWIDSTLHSNTMGFLRVYGTMGDPDTYNARDDVIRVHDATSRFDVYEGSTKYILRDVNPYESINGCDAILG